MVIVALETVTPSGSVALCVDDTCHAHVGDAARLHGERLPGEIVTFLAAHGRALTDIDTLAVVAGPGSFTGLRVGIAAIQGIAMASGLPVVAVPTLEALATSWLVTADGPALVVACLDGQRGEVFLAAWRVPGAASPGAVWIDECEVVLEPAAVTSTAIAALLAGRTDDLPVVIVGDGGRRYETIWAAAIPDARIIDAPISLAEAAAYIARRRRSDAVAPHALRPIYMRQPDAVLARERATLRAARAVSSCVIRRANSRDDVVSVESLQRQTFSNPWGAEAIRWELENTDVARLYVMHDAAGVLVAYCACWMVFDELHINSLAVDVRRRRQGVARQLLEFVLHEAVQAGASAATLEVRSSNQAARRLYDRLGFKVEGLRRDYYQDPREDAVILWHRTLGPTRALEPPC